MQRVTTRVSLRRPTRIDLFCRFIDSLPINKISDLSKLKVFADETISVTQKLKFDLGRVENIVGKGENAGYKQFLLFPQCFQKGFSSGSLKHVTV